MKTNGKLSPAEVNRGFDIQREIIEHAEAIWKLEAELDLLRTDDICDDTGVFDPIPTQSLWRSLERIEKRPSSYDKSHLPFVEEPCYAVLDLVVEKLLHTPISPLQLRGCSIHSRGTSVRFCISGEVDGNDFVRTHG